MALSASLIGTSSDCKAISTAITVHEENYNISIYLIEGDVETEIYRSVDLSTDVCTVAIPNLTDNNFSEIYVDASPELAATIESITNFNGIFKVVLYDLVTTIEFYTIGTCSLDCCLAGLIQSNLDCTCTSGDCCEDIKKAEKIFILTRGAILDAANGDIAGATEKYNKAVEMCDAQPCDCNC